MKFPNLKVSFIVILLTGASLLIYNQYQIQISVAEKIEKVLEGDLLNDTGIATNKALFVAIPVSFNRSPSSTFSIFSATLICI